MSKYYFVIDDKSKDIKIKQGLFGKWYDMKSPNAFDKPIFYFIKIIEEAIDRTKNK